MLVADKEHPAASHSLESQAGWASSLCPHSAAVSGSVMLCLIASLPSLVHLPSTIHRYGGTVGSKWPATQEGGDGSTHLLGSCSYPQELPCPHQYEDGFPEKEGCNSSDVSQQRELLSPLELGFGEGLSFPHQCKTGCSPSQHGERWQQDLGHLAKCTHSSPSRC